jgi:L-2,4-diaminobutyric acid acetyltransferase
MPPSSKPALSIRKITKNDIPEIYQLLTSNRPYVGLNSRYTYFLLARDFSDTCLVAQDNNRIVAFSSGYISPAHPDTFFNWETVVHQKYRGNGLQKKLLLHQLYLTGSKFFEGTINPSNEASKRNFAALAKDLNANLETALLFSEADFGGNGHEAEVLYRIGPISSVALAKLFNSKI